MTSPDMIAMHIGDREHLTEADAIQAAKVFRLARANFPKATILPAIGGYDSDPREIWQIDETRAYMRAWARHAGISDWRIAMQVPWEGGLGLALLQMCGVFAEDSPIKVNIKPCPGV